MKSSHRFVVAVNFWLWLATIAHPAAPTDPIGIRNEDVYVIFDFAGERPLPDYMTPSGWWLLYYWMGQLNREEKVAVIDGLLKRLHDKDSWLAAHILLLHTRGRNQTELSKFGAYPFRFETKGKRMVPEPGAQAAAISYWEELVKLNLQEPHDQQLPLRGCEPG